MHHMLLTQNISWFLTRKSHLSLSHVQLSGEESKTQKKAKRKNSREFFSVGRNLFYCFICCSPFSPSFSCCFASCRQQRVQLRRSISVEWMLRRGWVRLYVLMWEIAAKIESAFWDHQQVAHFFEPRFSFSFPRVLLLNLNCEMFNFSYHIDNFIVFLWYLPIMHLKIKVLHNFLIK